MQLITLTGTKVQRQQLDEEVRALLKRGWRLDNVEELGNEVTAFLFRDSDNSQIVLEQDVLEIVDANRGTSTRQDYVNTVIPLGIKALKSWLDSFDAAISQENMKEES